MDLTKFFATIVPGIIALIVVGGWVAATITGYGNTSDLRDVAIAVVAFYFGGTVHSVGVTNGANAANGIAP